MEVPIGVANYCTFIYNELRDFILIISIISLTLPYYLCRITACASKSLVNLKKMYEKSFPRVFIVCTVFQYFFRLEIDTRLVRVNNHLNYFFFFLSAGFAVELFRRVKRVVLFSSCRCASHHIVRRFSRRSLSP